MASITATVTSPAQITVTAEVIPLTYFDRASILLGNNIISYLPLDDLGGTTAADKSGNERNAAYTVSPTLASVLSMNIEPCTKFTTGAVDLYSATHSVFNGQEGTICGFAKMTGATVWTDATARYLFYFNADANNTFYLRKPTTDNQLAMLYKAGGVSSAITMGINRITFFHWLATWSKTSDLLMFYVNGVKIGSVSSLGTFAGTPQSNLMNLGSFGNSLNIHDGWMSDMLFIDRIVTDAEARTLSISNISPKIISLIGDSITASAGVDEYHSQLINLGYNNGMVEYYNRSVAGNNILLNMATQVSNCALDNSNIVIMQLGTNDDNAGDMAALQSIAETAIDDLQTSNPRATIYYLGVLPRWTNTGGGTVVDKSNIRTMQQAACTAKGIEYLDTFTTPWITAADTSDGLHPSAAGHAKIAAQLLTRL